LVKVVTIASKVGAFKNCIKNNHTGVLCKNNNDWYKKLIHLINNKDKREKIASNAFSMVMKNNVTAYTGMKLLDFLEARLRKNIAFVLPSSYVSGGVNVVIKHCHILKEKGYDVTIINNDHSNINIINQEGEINVVSTIDTVFHAFFHKMVATLWSTQSFLNLYPKVKDKYYLVQNFETDFYKPGNIFKLQANSTYHSFYNLKYLTISRWCAAWLKNKFHKETRYAPNGIDLKQFSYQEKNFKNGKIRILIEGNSDDYYKNVDESFQIANQLDKKKYEIF